jgi:hypothetical protein
MVTMNARVWAMNMRQDGNCEGMAADKVEGVVNRD